MYMLTLLVSFVFAINLSFAQGEGKALCLDEDDYLDGAPKRRTNQFTNDGGNPLYYFSTSDLPVRGDEIHRREYKVYVSTSDSLRGITAAKIITKGSPYCGDGQFTFNNQDFDQFKYPTCPSVLDCEKDEIFTISPTLNWSPPLCGCVNFRATVVNGKKYYKDNPSVQSGPLSEKICIKKERGRLNYLKALCAATSKSSAINVIGNPYFLNRHGLDANVADGKKLMGALQTRWGQIRHCCLEPTDVTSVKCMDDIRRRRIDFLCTFNLTDIPMVRFKESYTWGRKTDCCHLQAEQKCQCFGAKAEFTDITSERLLDFSMEDTDPANDLAIFGSFQDRDVLGYVTFVEFQRKEIISDRYVEPVRGTANKTSGRMGKKKSKKKPKKICCKAGVKSGLAITTRETTTAVRDCEAGSKKFVLTRKDMKKSVKIKLYEDRFATCCLKKWCCNRGEISAVTVAERRPENRTGECWKDFEKNVKSVDLKNDQEVCEKRFVECCRLKAGSINFDKGLLETFGKQPPLDLQKSRG